MNGFVKLLMAATAMVPASAYAQRGEWRGRGGEARAERPQQMPDRPVRQQNDAGQNGAARDFRAERRDDRQDFRRERTDDRRDFADQRRDDRQGFRNGDQTRPEFRDNRQDARADFRTDRRDDRQDFRNDRRDDRRDFRGNGGQSNWQSDRNQWAGQPRPAQPDRYRNDNRGYDRNWNRGGFDDRRAWNRGWRNDNRYAWSNYRASNRGLYRLPRYYAPSGWGYGYRRFGVGFTLSSVLFSQSYWIGDPYAYRLPEAYGPYRWVRYYNDALLVDLETGRVVDTVYDIFW